MSEKINIAMDGPVGAGKSSVADAVAQKLNILHLDTGAMYRAAGLGCIRADADIQDEAEVVRMVQGFEVDVSYDDAGQHTLLNGEDVTGLIRTEAVSMAASTIAKYQGVRAEMVAAQQRLAQKLDVLVDGRDICFRVLPDARVKIYLTASAETRAKRRWLELQQKGSCETYDTVLADLIRRDYQDMNRAVDPLHPTDDAVIVDTTDMTFDESVDAIVRLVKEKYHE